MYDTQSSTRINNIQMRMHTNRPPSGIPGIDSHLYTLLARVRLGAFDFDGVFTDNFVYVSERGEESVRCWRSDGLGLEKLRSIGIPSIILSTEANPVVGVRASKLKTKCIQGVQDKSVALSTYCAENRIALESVMFVGNDINDIPAFKIVGLPVGVNDSHPDIFEYVLYLTENKGGSGAVREVCDLVFTAHKKMNDSVKKDEHR
jgi:3-deoxy-D-manno-octulosonate 8-phosphate phosphatase (KDO 8-P phosphatase)